MSVDPGLLTDPDAHATGAVHEVWRWMRAHDAVHPHDPGAYPGFWSVCCYRDVRSVYGDPTGFSSRGGVMLRPSSAGRDPGAGLTMALTDPPRHRQIRSMIAPSFTERSLRPLLPEIRAVVADALERAIDHGKCEFVHEVANRVTLWTVCRMMGVPESDLDTVIDQVNEAFARHRSLASHAGFMGTVVDLMDDANGDAAGSVVDALMTTSTAGGALTDLEVVLNCENIVGASENAGLSLAAGVQAFVEHPDQWASLTEDRSRLNGAVEEIFRWASSATHSMRTATRTIELGSATIHEGDLVVVWLPSANRDNAVFHEPDRFQIGRPSARHLAFGAGEHHCVGRGLATSLAHILFGELIDRVKEIELCEDITPVRSIVVNGPERLPVRLVPR